MVRAAPNRATASCELWTFRRRRIPGAVYGGGEWIPGRGTGEIRGTLGNQDGIFELAGPALEEMAAELGYNEVVVQGTIQAELGPRRWRLAVSDWSIAPPLQVDRFVGTVEMEGGITSLVADDGARYRLLSPPDGLSAGEQVAVYAEVISAEGDELPALRWFGIESPPATQQYVMAAARV